MFQITQADKSTIVDEAVNYIRTLQQTLQKLQRKKLERLHGVAPINYEPSVVTPQKLVIDSREAFIADQVSSSNLANTSTPANSNSSNSVLPFVSRFPPIFQTWTSQNVILNVCGEQAQINICAPKKPGLFTAICYVLEKHRIDVVSAHGSSDQNWTMFMIQAHVSPKNSFLPFIYQKIQSLIIALVQCRWMNMIFFSIKVMIYASLSNIFA